jgi:hypothetical protein
MKTMFQVVTVTAALTCAGVVRTLAQDEPPSPPSPPPAPVAIVHDVQNVTEGVVHKAQADVENHVHQVQQRLKEIATFPFRTRRGKTDKSLVVRSSAMEPRTQGDLEEDMAIMTHILDKAVAERSSEDQFGHVAMGINVAFAPGDGPTRSIYVDGYGALFFLNVNFPLLPPPVDKNVEKEKAPKDSAWEEAKEEVYGQPAAKSWPSAPQVEYDAAKVTALKGALLDALKNASNIRNVRLDESITVCVIGAPLRAPVRVSINSKGGGGFGGSGGGGSQNSSAGGGFGAWSGSGDSGETYDRMVFLSNGGNDDASGNRTTLTIRVKKADCEAYAHGNLTTEEFRKRAVITVYGDPAAKP